jgi:hypothetical protein
MSTLTLPYRDDTDGARIHYEELCEAWDAARKAFARAESVHARRTARIWAGTAGILGAAAIAGTTAARYLAEAKALEGVPTALLLVSWLAMAVAYAAGIAVADVRLRAFVDRPRRTGDPRTDACRLEEALPEIDQRARVDAMERASVALPMIAAALLVPLSIHLPFYVLAGKAVAGFDAWIACSGVVVGHAHLALAYLSWSFAQKARRATVFEVAAGKAGSGWTAWLITVAVSALPGVVLLAIPPALTLATGLLFIPAMFGVMKRRIVRERRALRVD